MLKKVLKAKKGAEAKLQNIGYTAAKAYSEAVKKHANSPRGKKAAENAKYEGGSW